MDPAIPDADALHDEVHDIWERVAAFWDEYMGEGRDFQNLLIGPATERLLAIRAGEWVLDAGCGNGAFARRLAALGARVLAFDLSETFVELARARTAALTPHLADRIEYRVLDAADEGQLAALSGLRFNAAVCTMALMDMPEIRPLLAAVGRLLEPGGRFVFSVMHPCFNGASMRKVLSEEDREGELVVERVVQVARYLHAPPARGLGVIGQPVPHYYFHRPLHALFGACFQAGLVMDGLEEPGFDGAGEATGHGAIAWSSFAEIPPVLVARFRRL
jgi:SAM-dependent methyltransferase